MTTYRPVTTGLTGKDIAGFLLGHSRMLTAEGGVLLERSIAPNGVGRPAMVWTPPVEGSVRLDPEFWTTPERVNAIHEFMAFGIPVPQVVAPVARVDDLLAPGSFVSDAMATTQGPFRTEAPPLRVVPDQTAQERRDAAHTAEHHALALYEALAPLIGEEEAWHSPRTLQARARAVRRELRDLLPVLRDDS